MNEIQLAFHELFFGSAGGWIGFLFVSTLMLTVTYKIKLAGIMFMPASVMIGIMCLDQIPANSDLMWATIMYFLTPFFLMLIMWRGKSQI